MVGCIFSNPLTPYSVPGSIGLGLDEDDEGARAICARLKAVIHYDLVLWRPTILLDGEKVIEDGEVKFNVP